MTFDLDAMKLFYTKGPEDTYKKHWPMYVRIISYFPFFNFFFLTI